MIMKLKNWTTIVLVTVVVCGMLAAAEAKPQALMAKLAGDIDAAANLAPEVKTFVKTQLLPSCTSAVFAKETGTQNAEKVALEAIKKIDKKWMAAEDELPIQKTRTSNTCAKALLKILSGHKKVIAEAFVMDNQGALVGSSGITSDYWQGDEAKWKNSFNSAKGGLDVGKVKRDRSTDTVGQQVSLPIINAKGKVIGAVTWGIVVSNLKQSNNQALIAKLAGEIDASANLAPSVKKFVKTQLLPSCTSAVFAKETATQNAEKVTLDAIKKIDKQWMAAEDELPIQKTKTSNTCARELLKTLVANKKVIAEGFVMDNQGALVGASGITSDYWQGDEAKWKNSFKGAKGGVDIGKVKRDRSTDAVAQQVSLPIINAKGEVIGAVTWGIVVSKLK